MPPLERTNTSETFIKDDDYEDDPDRRQLLPIQRTNSQYLGEIGSADHFESEQTAKIETFEVKFDTSIRLMKEKCKKYEDHLAKRYDQKLMVILI